MHGCKCYPKTRNSAVINIELKNISKVIDSFIAAKSYQQPIHAKTFMLVLWPDKKDATKHLTLRTYFQVYHKKQVSDKDFNQFDNFWLPNRERSVSFPSIHLSLRNRVPAKIQLPVESTIGHVRTCHVFEGVITDYINDGTHYCPPRKIKEANLLNFKLIKYINQKDKKDALFFIFLILFLSHTVEIFIIPSLNNIIQ